MNHRSTPCWDSGNYKAERWDGEKLGIKGADLTEQRVNTLFFLLTCK